MERKARQQFSPREVGQAAAIATGRTIIIADLKEGRQRDRHILRHAGERSME